MFKFNIILFSVGSLNFNAIPRIISVPYTPEVKRKNSEAVGDQN